MGPPKLLAKLFIGLLFTEDKVYLEAKRILEKEFGIVDFESQAIPFVYTKYYEKELGTNINRRFISFPVPVQQNALFKIKIATNELEDKFRSNGHRQINIDPGILDLNKVILATTKDYAHRIYLNNGIFAEVTLHYQKRSFCPWDWTYPDYRSPEYIQIFNQLRDIYYHQLHNGKPH